MLNWKPTGWSILCLVAVCLGSTFQQYIKAGKGEEGCKGGALLLLWSLSCCCHSNALSPWRGLWILAPASCCPARTILLTSLRGSSTCQHPRGRVKGPASRVLELAKTARFLCVLGYPAAVSGSFFSFSFSDLFNQLLILYYIVFV